jgi:hypothetical protein
MVEENGGISQIFGHKKSPAQSGPWLVGLATGNFARPSGFRGES